MENFQAKYDVDQLKSLYTRYSRIPRPVNAFILNYNYDAGCDETYDFQPSWMKIRWNYRDTIQLKTINYQKLYHSSPDHNTWHKVGMPVELSNETLLEAYSKDEKKYVILKKNSESNGPNSEKQFIVVYDEQRVVKTIDIKSLYDRMTVIDNPIIADFALNEDGTILLCVVEISEKSKNKEQCSVLSKDYDINFNEYRQSWGERFSTIFHTSILVLDLLTSNYTVINKLGVSFCQPFFYKTSASSSSSDKSEFSVGCIGFEELPSKLGLIYCNNRLSALYGCKLLKDFSGKFSSPEQKMYYSGEFSLTSPRVYCSKTKGLDSKVYFLESDAGGAHGKSVRLVRFCFETRKAKTIVDNKEKRPIRNESGRFVYSTDCGPLYATELPKNCFTFDGNHLVMSTDTPTTTKGIYVNLEFGTVNFWKFPVDCCQIFTIKNDWIVAVGSSINSLPNVFIGKFNTNPDMPYVWTPIEDFNKKKIDKIKYETFTFESRDNRGKYVNCIWTTPADNELILGPTVVIPHGGPHSLSTLKFNQEVAIFSELGLKTCLVNYVGSTGVDDDYVNALLGVVGSSDVNDVYDAIDHLIKYKCADKDRIILSGGSHGGFLVTSLAGQHPELNLLACIAYNPVINIASNVSVSDIPDWCLCEALGGTERIPYTDLYACTPQNMATMYQVSPIAHVQRVKVPTLLLLGKEDLRVPCSQGLMYYRALKARAIDTRCMIYDDNHALYKISVHFNCFINVAKFIEKFLYNSSS